MNFALRFDLRNPRFAKVTTTERVRAAIDMATWADDRDALSVMLLEHHGSDDGYLPSPIVLASAMASVTRRLRIGVILVASFYDPLRLAEDLAVLDSISDGRIDVTLVAGYVQAEFDMFGVASCERPRRMTEVVETLRRAWTGEPFAFRDRTVRVTPGAPRPGGPPLVLGGSSPAAARRAARIGDGFVPVDHRVWAAYRDEMARLGEPDPGELPEFDDTTVVLDDDPDSAWDELLPYFVHETNAYAAWLDGAGLAGPYRAATAEQVRADGRYRVLTPDEYAESLRAQGDSAFAVLQPMAGGIPPARAWRSLELFERHVLPAIP